MDKDVNKMLKELSNEQKEEIIKKFINGETLKALSLEYNVYFKRIGEYLRCLGYKTSNKNIISNKDDIDKICSFYVVDGMSIEAISKMFKTGYRQISSILKEKIR